MQGSYPAGRIGSMPTVSALLDALDAIAPAHLALPDDPIGLQVGRVADEFDQCLVTLDATPEAMERAASEGARAVVCHHPLIYHPMRNLTGDGVIARSIRVAVQNSIAVVAAHTNWDAANGGVNDTLARLLGLEEVSPFGGDVPYSAYKLTTFVPNSALDRVIDSLAAVGAGEIGLYRRCAFYHSGTGTFEPQPGSNPTLGRVGERENADEIRLEMRVPLWAKAKALKALLESHPYEEPAYDLFQVEESPRSLPRMGTLPAALTSTELAQLVDERLGSTSRVYGKPDRKVMRVGLVGGAGGGYWKRAASAGCDALVTGEVRHHEAVEASETGMVIIEAGHYHTEQPGMAALSDALAAALPSASFGVFTPEAGRCGRPS
jgi:dinuclear metal center YbgI/SA1388 family protein